MQNKGEQRKESVSSFFVNDIYYLHTRVNFVMVEIHMFV